MAAEQYGVVARGQLRALGLPEEAIKVAVRHGRLVRLHRGVYAVAYVPRTRETVWSAAVLACGEGALLSHRSAAVLWGLRVAERWRPDVSVPARGGRAQPAIAVHRVALAEPDVSSHRGIPVTSMARTLADLSPLLDPDDLYLAIREAMYLRRFDLEAVGEVLSRRRARTLRLMVEDLTYTQDALERDFLALCRRYGVPLPVTQRKVEGARVDFLWPAQRLIVETDGWQAHGTLAAFQADRSKTNSFVAAGWRVLRFTHADVKRRPARTAAVLLRVLDE